VTLRSCLLLTLLAGFFGIVSDTPFSSISFTAAGDGDRWRLDNVSIARQGGRAAR
jgi:hypothetical protein